VIINSLSLWPTIAPEISEAGRAYATLITLALEQHLE